MKTETNLNDKVVGAIKRHYNHSRETHPYFCDNLLPRGIEPPELPVEEQIEINSARCRERLNRARELGNLLWNEVLNCEIWEATEAMFNRDYDAAVKECYDSDISRAAAAIDWKTHELKRRRNTIQSIFDEAESAMPQQSKLF